MLTNVLTLLTDVFEAVEKRIDTLEEAVDQKIGKLRSDVIDYVGRVVGEAKGDIIAAI